MAKSRPAPELEVDDMVQRAERLFGDHGPIVRGPTPDAGVELRDELALRRRSVSSYHGRGGPRVAGHGGATGFDERPETARR